MADALLLDIEVYKNYFLVGFRNSVTGNTRQFEMFEGHPLDTSTVGAILQRHPVISFNGINFDIPILVLALKPNTTTQMLKNACDAIIQTKLRSWQFAEQFNIQIPKIDHIDLFEVSPGNVSLKIYAGRMHCETMQDLPIEPEAIITAEQHALLRAYNLNDLVVTQKLYEVLIPQLTLRQKMSQEFKIDLRSKSDAQIAEAVLTQAVQKMNGSVSQPQVDSGTQFKFKAPNFINFKSQQLQDILAFVQSVVFTVPDSGNIQMPPELAKQTISIGNSTYQMGIGGLHSTEQSVHYIANEDFVLVDRDVTSYYPTIILNQGLAPAHLGEAFTNTYRQILDRRIKAKQSGDKVTGDVLKIVVNGSFGKFGSRYSKLYAPDLMIRTTLTGQLSLLMLIERLQLEGISVVSANTDGVLIHCPKHLIAIMESVIWLWEHETNFQTEETHYRAVYFRDVNSYLAIRTDSSVKRKGVFSTASLSSNPENDVCVDAVTAYLRDGKPIEETILECTDIRRFVSVRRVNNKAVWRGKFLGKAVRWYYAKGIDGFIEDKVNGYKVARTEGAKPLMELPDQFPTDIDFDWYIREAHSLLNGVGITVQELADA